MEQKAKACRIALIGANGRMGLAIQSASPFDNRFLPPLLVTRDAPFPAYSDHGVDVIVDFSTADVLPDCVDIAIREGIPYLVGTTGLSPAHHELLDKASQHIPVLQTANTSIGVAVLEMLVRQAATLLKGYDVEVHDRHHRGKKDAPSGTALTLGAALTESFQEKNEPRSVAFTSTRGGGAPGDHTVSFLGMDDAITITHQAFSRVLFAKGALDLAAWLTTQQAGRYTTTDFLKDKQIIN